MLVTCMACGHGFRMGPGPSAQESILQCQECGARMAFGQLLPTVVIEPYRDANGHEWVRRRFQDPKTRADMLVVDLDPQQAASEAKDILSMVIP